MCGTWKVIIRSGCLTMKEEIETDRAGRTARFTTILPLSGPVKVFMQNFTEVCSANLQVSVLLNSYDI